MELFPSKLFLGSKVAVAAPFVVRPLMRDDYAKDFVPVLGQLTQVGTYSERLFHETFDTMAKVNQLRGTYYVVVIEDKSRGKIVASASLIVEQKFIRQGAMAGHIEDVVTDKSVRGKGLGKVIIDALLELGERLGCYKILLDCSDDNVPFYERCGLQVKERQMVKYLNKQPTQSKL